LLLFTVNGDTSDELMIVVVPVSPRAVPEAEVGAYEA
jgi:hypothetical protein